MIRTIQHGLKTCWERRFSNADGGRRLPPPRFSLLSVWMRTFWSSSSRRGVVISLESMKETNAAVRPAKIAIYGVSGGRGHRVRSPILHCQLPNATYSVASCVRIHWARGRFNVMTVRFQFRRQTAAQTFTAQFETNYRSGWGNWGQIPIPIMQKTPKLPQSSHQLLARVALGFATDDTLNATCFIAAPARIHWAVAEYFQFSSLETARARFDAASGAVWTAARLPSRCSVRLRRSDAAMRIFLATQLSAIIYTCTSSRTS